MSALLLKDYYVIFRQMKIFLLLTVSYTHLRAHET